MHICMQLLYVYIYAYVRTDVRIIRRSIFNAHLRKSISQTWTWTWNWTEDEKEEEEEEEEEKQQEQQQQQQSPSPSGRLFTSVW